MSTNEKVMQYLKKKYPLENNKSDMPITIIVLDGQYINHFTDDIKNYLENFKDLEEIYLSICNLTSLKNLPDLPKLKKINLNDNHLKGEELNNLCKYKNLIDLRIANNDIKKIEEIKCLEKLPELEILDFTDSPITQIKNYRETIFENFKKLKYLDLEDKNGKVLEEDDDEDEEDEIEEDKEFIDDDKKEGNEDDEEEEIPQAELKEEDEEEGEVEEKEDGGEEGEEDEEEIKNPNPSKKRKLN